MATVIFSKERGQVAVFQDTALPGVSSLRLDNWRGFRQFKSIITRIAVSSQCNYQILHSLGGDAFIYVFGDRVGQIIISGLAFDSICGDPVGSLGIERIARYYSANRLAARKEPLKMTIGSALTLKMYLAGVSIDVEDVATRIWRFSFILLQVPEPLKKLKGGAAKGSSGSSGTTTVATVATPSLYPNHSTATASVDVGGYDPGLPVVPVPSGNGLDVYGTGPVAATRGFDLP